MEWTEEPTRGEKKLLAEYVGGWDEECASWPEDNPGMTPDRAAELTEWLRKLIEVH